MANLTAYGFVELKDLFSQRIVTIQAQTLQTAIEQSVAQHTRQINALMSGLVHLTTSFKYRYQLPAGGSLQPLDEKGNPKVVQPTGFYDVGLPLQGAGTAWGDDRISRAAMTVADANRYTLDAMDKDADWMRRHILNAIFNNASWSYPDDRYGNLTVQPLANNDGTGYVLQGGTFDTTQNHFFAQAAAISDSANPFPIMYQALDEHPSNSGPYRAYVATNLVASIQAMTSLDQPTFNGIVYGSGITRTEMSIDANDKWYGALLDPSNPADRFLGWNAGMEIWEWTSLPNNYMVGHASGVSDGDSVVAMREYEFAELQGLFPEFATPDGNLQVNRLLRYAGFGIQNRVAALVYRIGNASYAIPSGYTTGMMPA